MHADDNFPGYEQEIGEVDEDFAEHVEFANVVHLSRDCVRSALGCNIRSLQSWFSQNCSNSSSCIGESIINFLRYSTTPSQALGNGTRTTDSWNPATSEFRCYRLCYKKPDVKKRRRRYHSTQGAAEPPKSLGLSSCIWLSRLSFLSSELEIPRRNRPERIQWLCAAPNYLSWSSTFPASGRKTQLLEVDDPWQYT